MTTMPGLPPERQSLYPEPHRAGDWNPVEVKRASRAWILPVIGAGVGALALVIWGGLELGHTIGSSEFTLAGSDPLNVNAIQVDPGTCLATLPKDGIVATADAVECDVPHEAEAVADYTFADDEWPGRDAAVATLLDFCGSFIQPDYSDSSMFTATDWDAGLRWVAWAPTESSWAADERTGVCVVYRDGKMSGSFVDSSATFVN
jgi:hypothetical protein